MFPLIEALEAGPVNVSAVEGGQSGDADAGRLGRSSPLANCTLIARKAVTTVKQQGPSEETVVLTWAFSLERVTGNRTALSAWESVPSRPVTRPDLRDGASASNRERQLFTGVNGPLMARRAGHGLD